MKVVPLEIIKVMVKCSATLYDSIITIAINNVSDELYVLTVFFFVQFYPNYFKYASIS